MSEEDTPLVSSGAGAASLPVSVAAVNLKLPPFWPADPDVWFAQVEAQFTTRGITSQRTRYDYVVASLSPEFAAKVRDLILNVPDRPYDTLKRELIQRTCPLEQRRLQRLLHATELGDRKPSQLLRHMRQLLGDGIAVADRPLLRELFLQRLPPTVRMVLASNAASESLEDIAQLADRIIDVAPPTVAALTPTPSAQDEVQALRAEVDRLKELVTSLTSHPPPHPRSPSPRRTRRSTPPPAMGLCWYHARFGDRARKCVPPCALAENTLAGR